LHLEELELWIAIEEKIFVPSILGLHEQAERFEKRFEEIFGLSCRVRFVEKEHLEEVADGKKVIRE
jgi:phenylacetate-CoA ligase